jgi:hypothetical protein
LDRKDKNVPADDLGVARHLAARVIMALRAGFKVQSVSIDCFDSALKAVVCDWKAERKTYANDGRLVQRAFAFIYIGTIIDQRSSDEPSDAIRVQVDDDMLSAQEVREAAVEWRLVPSIADTNPYLHQGYKLANQLAASRVMKQIALETWFASHAKPLSLETLEDSSRFDW